MLFKFKVLYSDVSYSSNTLYLEDQEQAKQKIQDNKSSKKTYESRFIGMFGDCIKIRLYINNENELKDRNNNIKKSQYIKDAFINFLCKELGIDSKLINILDSDKISSMYKVELPDLSYEIIMSYL